LTPSVGFHSIVSPMGLAEDEHIHPGVQNAHDGWMGNTRKGIC
jgi:hypothetical protein